MEKYWEPSDYNRFYMGLVVGILTPALFFMLYFLFRFQNISWGEYMAQLMKSGKIVHVMSLSVFPNLIPFTFLMRTDRYRAGRGMLAATILWGLLIFALKLF